MKTIQNGKTTTVVPDMQGCLYQVVVGIHDFKCLKTEEEYQQFQATHPSELGSVALLLGIILGLPILVVFMVTRL